MIEHPIKKRLDELANGEVFRIVPFTWKHVCHESHALELLAFANELIDGIQTMCDVYERRPFEIEHYDNAKGLVSIYGRYAFSDVTIIDKPRRITINSAFHEISYGGKVIKLEGTYTLLELQSIIDKLNLESE